MTERLSRAVLEMTTESASFFRDIDKAIDKAGGLHGAFDHAGTRLQAVGGQLTGVGRSLALGVTAPLLAAAGGFLKLGSDAAENANKFDVVMGPAAGRVRARLQELTDTIPLTRGELEGMAGGIQDMLVPMGLARDRAGDMSAEMVELAGDLGSFNNVGTDQVLEGIKSALAGSSEPMRRFGVDTSVARLEALALEAGLIREGQALDNASRAQAVMLAIQRDSTDAMGDAARTADEFANSSRFLWRDLRDVGEMLGGVLIPMVSPWILKAREWVAQLKEMSPEHQRLVVGIGAFAAAAGPALIVLGTMATGLGTVLKGVSPLVRGIGSLSGVLGKNLGLVSRATSMLGLRGGLAMALRIVGGFISGPVGLTILVGGLLLKFEPLRNLLGSLVRALIAVARAGLQLVIAKFQSLLSYIQPVTDRIAALVNWAGDKLGGAFDWASEKLDFATESLNAMHGATVQATGGVKKLAPALPPLGAGLGDAGDAAGRGARKVLTWAEAVSEARRDLPSYTQVLREAAKGARDVAAATSSSAIPLGEFHAEFSVGLPLVDAHGAAVSRWSIALGAARQAATAALPSYRDLLDTAARGAPSDKMLISILADEARRAKEEMKAFRGEMDLVLRVPPPSDGPAAPSFWQRIVGAIGSVGKALSGLLSKVGDWARGVGDKVDSLFGGLFSKLGLNLGTLFGSQIGETLLPIIKGIGSKIVGIFAGIFSKTTAQDIAKQWGVTLSAALRDEIQKLGDEHGRDYGLALTLSLDKVIAENAPTSLAQVEALMRRSLETLSFYDRGQISAATAVDAMTRSLEALLPFMDEYGISVESLTGPGGMLSDLVNRMKSGQFTAEQLFPLFQMVGASAVTAGTEGAAAFLALAREAGFTEQQIQQLEQAIGSLGDSISDTTNQGADEFREWAEGLGVEFGALKGRTEAEWRAMWTQMGLDAATQQRLIDDMRRAADKEARSIFRDQADEMFDTEEDKKAFVRAAMKERRRQIRAAEKEERKERRETKKQHRTDTKEMADFTADRFRWMRDESIARLREIGGAWSSVVRGMIADGNSFFDAMVGNSVFPDTEAGAVRSFRNITAAGSASFKKLGRLGHVEVGLDVDRMFRTGPAGHVTDTLAAGASGAAASSSSSRRRRGTDDRTADEVRALREEMNRLVRLLPGQMERAARFGAQTAGRRV